MSIDRKVIDELFDLSRLEVEEQAKKVLADNVESILAHVAQLQELELSDVQPMISPGEVILPQRHDIIEDGVGREGLKGSAGYEEGLVRVPKIVG